MDENKLLSEITYKAIRGSGPGGQHVNKVSSKIVLTVNLQNSEAFTDSEKQRLIVFFSKRLNESGILQLSADDSRSQHQNKKMVTQRLLVLVREALKEKKKRKQSKPSKSSILKNKAEKKKLSQKKILRRKPGLD